MCQVQIWCFTVCALLLFLENVDGSSLGILNKEKQGRRARGMGGGKGGRGVGGKGVGGKGVGGGKIKDRGEEKINNDVKVDIPAEIHDSTDIPSRWSSNIMKGKISATTAIEDTEPGFDFSKEEMKKLKIWPGGIIPYFIDDFSFDKVLRDRIRTFLEETNSVTGLNFVELQRSPEDETTRWVLFVNRQGLLGCADHSIKNFTTEGVQKVVLGYDCLSTGGELAEAVLALVGIPAQHNAPNRSKYIRIMKKNIMPEKAYLFEALQDKEWLFHDVDYDFSSATHYPLHKYTINGMATIKPTTEVGVSIGEGNGYSITDIRKIKMLYNFISKKHHKTVNLPKCNKLFNVGSNFSNYDHRLEDKVEPRKKPNKYLGLPEDIPNTKKSSANINDSSNKIIKKENEEGTMLKKEKTKNNDSMSKVKHPLSKETSETNNDKKLKKRTKNLLSANADNALMYISDFNTDEEFRNRQNQDRIFTRAGG